VNVVSVIEVFILFVTAGDDGIAGNISERHKIM
jgi:hypothetical protein